MLSIKWGRVCDKRLCFKPEPSAECPDQPAKTFINFRLCMCWKVWPQQNLKFFLTYPETYLKKYPVFVLRRLTSTKKLSFWVLNLLEDVVNVNACSWWMNIQIYALHSIRFTDIIDRLLLSHLTRSVQLAQIDRQIIQIQMVLPIRWCGVN